DLTLAEYAGYFAMQAAAKVEQSNAGGEDSAPAEALALYEKARGYFEKVYAVKADSAQPNLLVGYVSSLTKLGRAQEAAEMGGQFVSAQPDNVALRNAYALALKEAGQLNEALAAVDALL